MERRFERVPTLKAVPLKRPSFGREPGAQRTGPLTQAIARLSRYYQARLRNGWRAAFLDPPVASRKATDLSSFCDVSTGPRSDWRRTDGLALFLSGTDRAASINPELLGRRAKSGCWRNDRKYASAKVKCNLISRDGSVEGTSSADL